MKIKQKVSGYALIYTLFITCIITLIASFILIQISNAGALSLKRKNKTKLIESEQNLLRLAKSKHFNKNRSEGLFQVYLYDEIKSQIRIENWGAFKLIVLENINHIDSLFSAAFIGQENYSFRNTAIYMRDKNQPLSISGNTLIRGKSFLPKSGLKRGNINGKKYKKTQMIDGQILKSTDVLPEVKISGIENLKDYIDLNQFKFSAYKDSIFHSFQKDVIHIHLGDIAYLDQCFYKGQIVLSANQKIFISKHAFLEDVIIIAPEIELEEKTEIAAQLIAEREIKVSEKCKMNYPSLLYLNRKNEDGKITIGKDSQINGLIIANLQESSERNVLVSVEKDSEVNGLIYSKGIVDMQGSIKGTLICDNLQYKGNGSFYLSYLHNSIIDNNALPKFYVLPEIFNRFSNKKIMKWLD